MVRLQWRIENMMTRKQLRDAMGQAYGAWYWRQPGLFAFKPGKECQAERVLHILTYRRLRADLRAGRCVPSMNARGNELVSNEDADIALGFRGGDRYTYDDRLKGWHQFDTWQDAPYFGVWFNDKTRQTFTYCEGDRTLVNCPSPETYAAELADMIAFYQRTRAA
jgi:hypothetical protein